MCRLSWNLGASTSWNPLGLFRPVMGLLYLYHAYICIYIFEPLLSHNIFITEDSSPPLISFLCANYDSKTDSMMCFLFRSFLWTAWLVALGFLVRAKEIYFFLFLIFNLVVTEVGSPWTSRSAVGAHLKKRIPRDSNTYWTNDVNNLLGNAACCIAQVTRIPRWKTIIFLFLYMTWVWNLVSQYEMRILTSGTTYRGKFW